MSLCEYDFKTFHRLSTDQIEHLKVKTIKKRSKTKMLWGVKAYQEWCENRLSDGESYDEHIFNANLDDVGKLTKENLEHSLCIFIADVCKLNGDNYPGLTLYQLTVSIQRFLRDKGFDWKLVDGPDFKEYRVVLDNVMQERARNNIGMVKKQAQLIPLNFESTLGDKGLLGEHKPEILRNTVLFLIGINCGLCAGDEHYDLQRDTPGKPSQLSFQRDENGIRCLVYQEDTVTKTNTGGLAHMRKDRKIVWVQPSKNVLRCPVRLVDKYMSLCPLLVTSRSIIFTYIH